MLVFIAYFSSKAILLIKWCVVLIKVSEFSVSCLESELALSGS